jgi:hypothetical protein
VPIRRETIKCLHCEAIFASDDNLNQHMEKTPCGSLKFKCSHCKGGLISEVIFTLHQSSKIAKSLYSTFQSRESSLHIFTNLATNSKFSTCYWVSNERSVVFIEKKVMW